MARIPNYSNLSKGIFRSTKYQTIGTRPEVARAGNDFFVHPLKKKNQGLRSGRPLIKAGKIINKDKYGYDVLDDYFSESDAEYTLELHKSSIELQGSVKEIEDDRIIQSQPTQVTHGTTSNKKCFSFRSTASSVNSKVSTGTAGYNPVGWLHNKNYGRRTGKNIKAGKIIRKQPDGFEVLDDYWSESDADSLMLSKLSDSTRQESPTKNLQEEKSDEESKTNTESGTLEYEDELDHNSSNSSSQNIEDISRNHDQSSLLSNTQNLDSRAVKRHSQRHSRGQSLLGSVLSEKNQTSFNKSVNKKRGRFTKSAVQNTSNLNLTKSLRNSVDIVTSSHNDSLCDSNTNNSSNEQSDQTHWKSMQNNVSQIQQTSQRKRSSEVTEDNLLDSGENQQKSNNSSVSDRNPESEVLIDNERFGTDHDSESSGAKNEISPGKENCTPETSKQQDTHSVLTQKSHTDKTEYGMQKSVLEMEHKILTYEDDIDTNILPSNKSSKMSDPALYTVSLTRSTLTNVSPYMSRTKTLSSNDQNEYSVSFSEKNKEIENDLSKISKENDKTLHSKTDNSSESDVENRKESNTLRSVTVSSKSFRLPSTVESPESIVIVEDEDSDVVTNKSLKPKTTRKSNRLSNSLKDELLVSKSRKSDYSQVSIGGKSVSKTGSKSKHLSKVNNNKNFRKSKNSDEEDMEKLLAETAGKLMIERSIEHLVSQTTRKSTLEGNSEQSMSKTAGKSKKKDNVGCNLEVQETVERFDSEEEAGEQMDVPNEPKIMSKPSRRSKRSSKVTTNRTVNYQKKSTMAKKLNKTTSEISQTHNQLHISVHKEEKPTSTRRSKMEKKSKKLITKKDKKNEKYSLRSKRNSGRGSQSQSDDKDVVYTNNKGGNTVVTHADVHVSYEESEHSLSDEEEITQFSSHQSKSPDRKTTNSTDKKSIHEKDKDNEEDVSDEEQTPTNTGDEDKEPEDKQNTVTKSQDIIGISKTHGMSHLSQAASIVIGGNGTGSLTKFDSDSVGVTPSFKTRKRLSYSIAAFDSSQMLEEEIKQSDTQLSTKIQKISITDKQPLKHHKKTFALDSDSDASTNFLFLSQDVVQHPNTVNIDTALEIPDIINLSKSKDKKSKTRKSETVKEREDQIKELSEKPVAKAAGKRKKGRKKKISKESTIASPCHDQQVDTVQMKGNESKQIAKNVNLVNKSKTEIALDTDNGDSFGGPEQRLGDLNSGSEQHLGDMSSVKLNRVQTEKVAKKMSLNKKGNKINRRRTTNDVSEKIQKTQGRKSNVEKYKKSRRSTPNIKLLEEEEREYITVENLSQYEQKISKYRRSKNGKKSFVLDSADSSTISEDIVYVEKADDVQELQTDVDNHVSQRENIEEEEVQIEEAFDIEEPQADLENQVSRREDTVDKVNVQIHINREADVQKISSEMEELYHGDEEEIMTVDVPQEETTITKRLSFSGERKSKKKDSKKGKNDSIKDVSPPNISKKNQESDTDVPQEDATITRRLSFSGEKKFQKKNSKKGKNKKRKNDSIKDVSPPKVSKKNQENDTEVVTTPAAMKMINHIQTPDTESNVVPEEGFKSGISFRHKRRTIIIQEESEPNNLESTSIPTDDNVPTITIQDEVDQDNSDPHILHKDDEDIGGKIPNIIRRRSSIKYAPSTDPISVTPCIVKSKTNKRSKDRRVTISRKVLETSYDIGNTSEMTDSPGQNTTDGPPVHIFEVTTSQTPDKIYNQQLNKIISPEPAPEGLRRSHRTRVQTLESYKLERPIYEKRKSGGFAIVGIQPSITEGKLKALELRRKNKLKSRIKTKTKRRLSSRRLSTHVELPSTIDTTLDTEITVYNPDSNEDVLLKCVGPKEEAILFGPIRGQDCSNKDPFFMTRSLNQPGFGAGILQIKGLMEKPMQITTKGSLIYQIIFGKMLVTIESSSFILSTSDSFFVPRGNRYCIKNLRKDNAKLHYVVLKDYESDEESD